MSAVHAKTDNPLRQPKAVWAVAFACTVSFMGIGLVDPILPALAESLKATPSQVSLLFTSFLLVTAVAMLGVNWVSSRIGFKRTLILGLAVIVVFAGLAGMANSIEGIVWFRAGWGLGNALFIATSLAVIVASARGGFGGAIILYESALGLGIAVGPLLGGLLGSISWRGPFFGVTVLMGIALVATLTLVPEPEVRPAPTPPSAPLKALGHRGLFVMGLVALLYNWGFFTLLGFAPYPMHLHAHQLGFVFTAWGVLVALGAVVLAPRLQARFGTVRVLLANLATLGVLLLVIAVFVGSPVTVIIAVIASGLVVGVNNTLTTQAVMVVSPVDKSIAAASYGFIRYIGGGLAPLVAGKVAESFNLAMAFALGAAACALAIPVLLSGRGSVTAAEFGAAIADVVQPTLEPLSLQPLDAPYPAESHPVVVAIGYHTSRDAVVDRAAELAIREGRPLEIIHVFETEILGDQAVTPMTRREAEQMVRAQLDRLAQRDEYDVESRGVVLASVGDLAAVGRVIGRHMQEVDARAVVLRRSARGTAVVAGMVNDDAAFSVVLLGPESLVEART